MNERRSDGLARSFSEGINIFGAGGFARSVATAARQHGIVVHSLLVSHAAAQSSWDGIPIRGADAATVAEVPIWIGVFNREAHSDYSMLRRKLEGFSPSATLVWPQEFYAPLKSALGWRFWLEPLEAYPAAQSEIASARRLLEDAASREAFDSLLNFRCLDSAGWESPQPSGELQYLPGWLRSSIDAPLRIVDAGAYRGETLRELAGVVDIEEAWTFEPDPENYAALVEGLADMRARITHLPAGLSSHCGVARFAAGLGEGSSLGADGASQVALVALDKCLHDAPVNFLKLDVEGHELEALLGARATLQRWRPILAVAGYHCWDDLWRIPAFIDGLKLGYRLRLGLHGHNSFDSVFYAY